MPCMCYYEPSEESKRFIKKHCQELVEEIKRLEKIGDPLGCTLKDIKELLDHLYDPSSCKEREKLIDDPW